MDVPPGASADEQPGDPGTALGATGLPGHQDAGDVEYLLISLYHQSIGVFQYEHKINVLANQDEVSIKQQWQSRSKQNRDRS